MQTSCVVTGGCGRTVFPCPRVGLYSWPWQFNAVDSSCINRLQSFKFVDDTLSVPALISLVTLIWWPFDLEPGAHYNASGGQPSYQFWYFWDFLLLTNGPIIIMSDGPRDLATFTFNLRGHGDCGWYGSSCSICVPRLNFVSLPVRKIWHTFGLTISRLGELDLWPSDPQTGAQYCPWDGQRSYQFWPLTLKLVRVVASGVGTGQHLPILAFLRRFVSAYRPTPVRRIM